MLIGQISQPKGIIKNVKNVREEIEIANDTVLQPGINYVKCHSSLEQGVINIATNDEFNETCIQINKQMVRIVNHEIEICIKNFSSNNFELYKGAPLSVASREIINNVSSFHNKETQLNEINEENLDSDVEGRFKFPLSEEEGRKLLESAEPFSLILYDEGEEEEFIDWKKELGKEGVFPPPPA